MSSYPMPGQTDFTAAEEQQMRESHAAFKPGSGLADTAKTMPPTPDEWSTYRDKPPQNFQDMPVNPMTRKANNADHNVHIPAESGDSNVITPDAMQGWKQLDNSI
jgi:hypothetical protein